MATSTRDCPANAPARSGLQIPGIRVNLQVMSLNLTDDEIHGLIDYAGGEFATERYPFAPALKPIRETLAKLEQGPQLRCSVLHDDDR